MGKKAGVGSERAHEYIEKFKAIVKNNDTVVDTHLAVGRHDLASRACYSTLHELDLLDEQYKDAIKYMGGMGRRRDESICESDREYIIKKYKHRCAYCGKKGDARRGPDGVTWQIDHIIPYSWGGATERGNFALSCRQCNCKKHANWWCPNA